MCADRHKRHRPNSVRPPGQRHAVFVTTPASRDDIDSMLPPNLDENGPLTPKPKSNDKRKAGRLGLEMLKCQYGPIINLSVGGMRISCRRIPFDATQIVLRGVGNPIMLKARMAWHKRIGLFKHEVGFEFIDVTPQQKQQLTSLATVGRDRLSM